MIQSITFLEQIEKNIIKTFRMIYRFPGVCEGSNFITDVIVTS